MNSELLVAFVRFFDFDVLVGFPVVEQYFGLPLERQIHLIRVVQSDAMGSTATNNAAQAPTSVQQEGR